MRKIYLRALMILSLIFIITGCSSKEPVSELSNTLGIDLSGGIISQSIDTHGGFHGDGITYIKMTFSDKEGEVIIESMMKKEYWSRLPLTDNLNIALYGIKSPSEIIGPYVKSDIGNSLFPIVENGYYFFIDRHSESVNIRDDTELYNRSSFNFTIAIFDIDSKTLYYCEFDT